MISQQFLQKSGNYIGRDDFKKITGTKIHVTVEQNGLQISILLSSANQHDGTKFIDVMRNISEYLNGEMIQQIISVYADKEYDSGIIRDYLKNRNINSCISFRKNSNETSKNKSHKKYNMIR